MFEIRRHIVQESRLSNCAESSVAEVGARPTDNRHTVGHSPIISVSPVICRRFTVHLAYISLLKLHHKNGKRLALC